MCFFGAASRVFSATLISDEHSSGGGGNNQTAEPSPTTTKRAKGKQDRMLSGICHTVIVFIGQCLMLLRPNLRIFKRPLLLLTDLTWIRRTGRSGRWGRCTCWAWSRNRLHTNSGRSLRRRKGRRVKQQKNTRCQVEDGPVLTLWRQDLASA